jgi:hypothetical protein
MLGCKILIPNDLTVKILIQKELENDFPLTPFKRNAHQLLFSCLNAKGPG